MFTTAGDCRRLVDLAESNGIESVWAVEHVLTPAKVSTRYPYTDSGALNGLSEATLCDPVVWLSFMAGISTTLRLGTGILILPQRHPAYVAKEWATLDRLSGGRAMLGVGLGWLAEEMEALGVPFAERAARTEESIAAIRTIWASQPSTFRGRFYQWEDMISNPGPVQRPGVPILVGGHSPAAARRAARLGDGFFWPGSMNSSLHAPGDDKVLAELLDTLRTECDLIGRDPREVEVTVGVNNASVGDVERLRAAGVSRIVVNPGSAAKVAGRVAQFREFVAL
ncbi:MAG TPA: LLM class F420-dependent oxidoreductase [Acidimicrobiia bacterium]|nr:LLM class F420-dependent oxidoreductase [Acidimicrobiia bacterium]